MKRSLFKRPTWSSTQPTTTKDESDEDLFRRVDETYLDTLAREERKRQSKKEREQKENDAEQGSRTKRRRTSHSDSPKQNNSRGDGLNALELPDGLDFPGDDAHSSKIISIQRLSQQLQTSVANSQSPTRSSRRINRDEVESGSQSAQKTSEAILETRKKAEPVILDESDDSDSDEVFRELKRKAREARLGIQSANKVLTPILGSVDPFSQFESSAAGHMRLSNEPEDDPVLTVSVRSQVPNSKPLIAQRKLSQKLGQVRIAFFRNFENSAEKQRLLDTAFLTYKGNRLFDVTSMKSLGIRVDDDGVIFEDGGLNRLSTPDQTIHFELVTPEIYEHYRQTRARYNNWEVEEDEEEDIPVIAEREDESAFVVMLKNKNLEEVKIKVTPTTTINAMIDEFRAVRSLDRGIQINLYFDGDCLGLENTTEFYELGNMDRIDVHIK